MHTLTAPQAEQFIETIVIDDNEPSFMWGGPGIGKSQIAEQVIDKQGGVLVDIRLSQYDSVDMRGIPAPVETTKQTEWYSPSTLPFTNNPIFPDDRPILLFLDEMNSGSPPTLAVAYQLVNDRRVGEHILRPNVRILCAGNREGDKGVTNRMPKPLANRLTHFELGVSVDATCAHFGRIGLAPEGIAFLMYRKELLNTFDPASADKAFATPRTWEKALRRFMNPKLTTDIKMAAMAGAVGEGPSSEFWGFFDLLQKVIPIPKIVKDPKGCELPDELGMQYATTISVSGSMNLANVEPLHTYIKRMPPEFTILCWTLAVKRDRELYKSKAYMDFAQVFKTLF